MMSEVDVEDITDQEGAAWKVERLATDMTGRWEDGELPKEKCLWERAFKFLRKRDQD